MTVEPLWIDCEGSGARVTHQLCPMCGLMLAVLMDDTSPGEIIPKHQRQDVLAMLDRGDFGWQR